MDRLAQLFEMSKALDKEASFLMKRHRNRSYSDQNKKPRLEQFKRDLEAYKAKLGGESIDVRLAHPSIFEGIARLLEQRF